MAADGGHLRCLIARAPRKGQRFDQYAMALARHQRAERADDDVVGAQREPRPGRVARPGVGRDELRTVHPARYDADVLADGAAVRQRIRHPARNRDHAVNRAIVQVPTKPPVRPIVHPPRDNPDRRQTTRVGRKRMRPGGVKVHDIVAPSRKQRAQAQACPQIHRIADAQRPTDDPGGRRTRPQRPVRIAKQLRLMTHAQEFEGQPKHLRLAATKVALRIDSSYPQGTDRGGVIAGIVIWLSQILQSADR